VYTDLYRGEHFPDGFPVRSYRDRIAGIYIRHVQGSTAAAREEVDRLHQQAPGVALYFEEPREVEHHAQAILAGA
jgi:phosphatidate phosphatase APP1